MSSELEKYESVQDLEATRTATQFSQEISDSLILKHNWGSLLSAAPLALSFVGACQVVASSPTASGLKLKKPDRGFTHLQYDSLQANLVYLVDVGRKTFLDTEARMDKLVMHSRYLFAENGAVNRIIDALGDEESAKRTLPGCMSSLKSAVEECEDHLRAIETKFDIWLDIAQELSQVATDSEHDTINKRMETEEEFESQKLRKKFAEDERQSKDDAVKEAQRRMLLAEEAFKQASKNIPSGWDAIGMSVVEGLSSSVLTIGGALMTALSPNKYVAMGTSIIGALKSGISGDDEYGNHQHAHSENYPRNDDPALSHVETLQLALSLLLEITKGTSPNSSSDDGTKAKSSPSYVRTLLQIIDEDLHKDARPGSFSYDTQRIIHEALEVVSEVDRTAKAQREISGAKTTAVPEKWQKKVTNLQSRAASLKARKDSLPGLATGLKPPHLKEHKFRRSTGQSMIRMQMETASMVFESSTASLQAQREAYDASVTKLNENLERISEIQHAIGRLQAENMTLDNIVRVLRASISALSGLKEQISSLLRFFQGISAMVEFASRGPCRDLLDTLESGMDKDSSGAVADISYRDFQKQLLFNTTLMIRGYFSVVFEVSRLYTSVSREYIIPGVNLIDRLGLSQSADSTVQRNVELENYKRGAVSAIRELAEKKQQALLSRMEQRMAYIQKTTSKLPPCSQQKAIKEAAHREVESTAAAAEQDSAFIDETARLLPGCLSEEL